MQTVESLCVRYGLDTVRAQHVAATATQLFDATRRAGVHAYGDRERLLLQAGAMLLDVGAGFGLADHHLAGRDLVLAAPLQGFSQVERAVLACIVALHDGDAQPERESLLDALDDRQRRLALTLAALTRVADALDASHLQTTAVQVARRQDDGALVVRLLGPHSHAAAEAADAKADLWRALFGPVVFEGYLTSPGLSPDDALAEAWHKALRYRLDQGGGVTAWRIGATTEATPERVRKLRAAVRRMRNDLRLFGPGLRAKRIRALAEGLDDLSRALRRVRAYDALLANLRDYSERCDAEDRDGLSPLAEAWSSERMRQAEALAAFVSGDEHRAWLEAITASAASDSVERIARRVEAGRPSCVRHIVAAAMAQRLSRVRARMTCCPIRQKQSRSTRCAWPYAVCATRSRRYRTCCRQRRHATGCRPVLRRKMHTARFTMRIRQRSTRRNSSPSTVWIACAVPFTRHVSPLRGLLPTSRRSIVLSLRVWPTGEVTWNRSYCDEAGFRLLMPTD